MQPIWVRALLIFHWLCIERRSISSAAFISRCELWDIFDYERCSSPRKIPRCLKLKRIYSSDFSSYRCFINYLSFHLSSRSSASYFWASDNFKFSEKLFSLKIAFSVVKIQLVLILGRKLLTLKAHKPFCSEGRVACVTLLLQLSARQHQSRRETRCPSFLKLMNLRFACGFLPRVDWNSATSLQHTLTKKRDENLPHIKL